MSEFPRIIHIFIIITPCFLVCHFKCGTFTPPRSPRVMAPSCKTYTEHLEQWNQPQSRGKVNCKSHIIIMKTKAASHPGASLRDCALRDCFMVEPNQYLGILLKVSVIRILIWNFLQIKLEKRQTLLFKCAYVFKKPS